MIETLILSITAYIGTNIDDMIINTFFFASAEERRDVRNIVLGKYLGTGLLVLFSVIGAMGLSFLPMKYIGYLGIVPIGLGIKEIVGSLRNDSGEEDEKDITGTKSSGLAWNVAVVTMANGADNIGVYVPLFTGFGLSQYVVFLSVFAAMTAVWCWLGHRISKLPFLRQRIEKNKKVIVPIVYIALGLYILM